MRVKTRRDETDLAELAIFTNKKNHQIYRSILKFNEDIVENTLMIHKSIRTTMIRRDTGR